MAKSKHAKPDEFQKEQIRHLKKELRRKDQEIKRLQKELGYSQNKSSEPRRAPKEETPNCPECARGFLQEIELVGRIFDTCPICKYRSKARKALKRKKHG